MTAEKPVGAEEARCESDSDKKNELKSERYTDELRSECSTLALRFQYSAFSFQSIYTQASHVFPGD